MKKAYRFKLNPNRQQRYALARTLDVCRELYNDALQERKMHRMSCYDQIKELPALKAAFPIHKNVYSQVLQQVLDRLDKSFKNFLRSGFGFPRFKSARRFASFTYPQGGFALNGKQLSLSKIGNIRVRLSRELPADAVVKTCTVKRSVNGWFATLVFEYMPTPLPVSELEAGFDRGITKLIAVSDGSFIENPRFYQKAQAELRRSQRRVARRVKGSNRRRKAVVLLKKLHEHIANARKDFLHKETTKAVQKFGFLAMEDLQVQNMVGYLPKQILDAAWSMWKRFTSYKAEEAGRTIGIVPPQYTSQECGHNGCKCVDKRNRNGEKFCCIKCGFSEHADTHGAKRVLARAKLARTEPSGDNVGRLSPCVA